MKTFREQLKEFDKTDLEIWKVLCAKEVDIRCPDLSDDQFESLTDFVYDWVMNSEIMPAELMGYIATGLADKDFTLNDFTDYSKHEKITEIIKEKKYLQNN